MQNRAAQLQNAYASQETQQPAGPQHHKYRTKPCRYFNMPSGCKNGEGCNFLHTLVGPDYVFDPPPNRMGGQYGGGPRFGGGQMQGGGY